MSEHKNGLSSIAVGYAWVVRITAFSLEFAALVGLGYFVDRRFGFGPWGLLIGAAFGIFAFISGLLETAKRLEEDERADRARENDGVGKK